ncbi:FHA domain-containing protein [Propioniciclava coleopterorum]|uniref:FHA domain-containing protein n=1 Tax=Propioniciclava coleopterorum TaxID=2714937 RepID=A0A6G7Y7C0_9ACTN|nr:FHA domain-containing protein [Propioniciclava coleopterorum]QIK72576.1 FHA domain-containing protein [Propioniciclava coleopterorum]
MSELLVFALKFAFLALLWVFILFTGAVIRSDLFGRRVPANAVEAPHPAQQAAEPRTKRRARAAAQVVPTTLRITRGKQAGLTMALGDQLKIGRSADCQLILDDDYVSTRHARIYRSGQGYVVEDLGSTNGTYLNNERLSGPTRFTPADTLRIGRTLLTVEA